MRFGAERNYENKVDQFFERLQEHGNFLFTTACDAAPLEARQFVKDQFVRFNVPLPESLEFLCSFGPCLLISLVDFVDPYLLFWAYSDVVKTEEWHQYTFEITQDGVHYFEANPEYLETFKYDPEQGRAFFESMLNQPGLASLPAVFKSSIDDYFNEYLYQEAYMVPGFDPIEVYKKVEEACVIYPNGVAEVNQQWVDAYFDLTLWASCLWLLGPLSLETRMNQTEVAEAAVLHSECILYDGEVIAPKFYRKALRPPMSCYRCGVDAWCVENTLDDSGTARYICEGCLSDGAMKGSWATCGNRICRYTACQHNAYYGQPEAFFSVSKNSGQLSEEAARKRRSVEVNGKQDLLKG